jgi:hypothetical protein
VHNTPARLLTDSVAAFLGAGGGVCTGVGSGFLQQWQSCSTGEQQGRTHYAQWRHIGLVTRAGRREGGRGDWGNCSGMMVMAPARTTR